MPPQGSIPPENPATGAAPTAVAAHAVAAPTAPAPSTPPPGKDPRDTPAMRQYARFKKLHPECLLLFRMGDFYEMFDDDAVSAAKAIGLTLTQRTSGIPMAGVPFHQIDVYVRKLIAAGFRIAVCDQIQDPREAKGIIERAVTRVITPGTLVDENLLDDDQPNVLAAVCFPPEAPTTRGSAPSLSAQLAAVAIAELSTGALTVTLVPAAQLADELARARVRELLYPETADGKTPPRIDQIARALGISTAALPGWHFRPHEARQSLCELYRVQNLAGFGLPDGDPLILPCGALVRYLTGTQLPAGDVSPAGSGGYSRSGAALAHLAPPKRADAGEFLIIDAVSLRALEVDRAIRAGGAMSAISGTDGTAGSLIGTFLSHTGRHLCRTPMGRRLLRAWLVRPLRDLDKIIARQACVAALAQDRRLALELATELDHIQDVARIAARVALRRATPRDVVALGRSLARCAQLSERADRTPALRAHQAQLAQLAAELAPLSEQIARLCKDDAPAHLREGGLIRDGVDPELDRQRTLTTDASHWMAQYQAALVAQHDLPNLKVGFNRVFGYFIELPKAQAARAPAAFSRRQTLTGAERYITPELKDFEDKVTHAQARAVSREQALFDALCEQAATLIAPINRFGELAAELDVLSAFADKAAASRWTRPTLVPEPLLRIIQGRHPVLDARAERDFVPNDLTLGTPDETATLALITGPNMAGKSTFIRQTALIVLLAHTGSFVPAEAATIGLTDRIFTRVGADDALFAGQSTFMVEMTETASILHHATPASLVILDEIGRGTSTLDGLSLAWAIAQTLAQTFVQPSLNSHPATEPTAPSAIEDSLPSAPSPGPRTLFATHYHELTQLPEVLPGRVVNLHVAVREFNDQIVFLHRIMPGRAEKSFGIQVARLAGVPARTIELAKEVLENLSVQHAGLGHGSASTPGPSGLNEPASTGQSAARRPRGPRLDRLIAAQPSLFESHAAPHAAVSALAKLKLEGLSPMQAFDELRRLKDLLK